MTAKRIVPAERDKQILELRKQGLTAEAIARNFEISCQMVGRILRRALGEAALPTARELLQLQTQRLEAILQGV